MSSLASLTAVIPSTRMRGTAVVNQEREETCGISCEQNTQTLGLKMLQYLKDSILHYIDKNLEAKKNQRSNFFKTSDITWRKTPVSVSIH